MFLGVLQSLTDKDEIGMKAGRLVILQISQQYFALQRHEWSGVEWSGVVWIVLLFVSPRAQ
jgi:hypothetical protein